MGLFDIFKSRAVPTALDDPLGALAYAVSNCIAEIGLDKFVETNLYFGITRNGAIEVGNEDTIRHNLNKAVVLAWANETVPYKQLRDNYNMAVEIGSHKTTHDEMMAPMKQIVLDWLPMYKDQIATQMYLKMDMTKLRK